MPLVRVTRHVHFSAAHRLFRADWTDERNAEVFGNCANPEWHGHNYDLEVTVEGAIDPETGFVMDLKVLKHLLEARVIADVDHKNLNTEVAWLRSVNPTTENVVVAIWDRLVDALPEGVRLAELVLHETPRNSATYRGAKEAD
jgi:6-pyruvoyltetrahydropterin/6-carboxytetrahydropterin synthase